MCSVSGVIPPVPSLSLSDGESLAGRSCFEYIYERPSRKRGSVSLAENPKVKRLAATFQKVAASLFVIVQKPMLLIRCRRPRLLGAGHQQIQGAYE